MTLRDSRAIEAIASPHRLEIITVLGELGKASIAEIARCLGRTPHSLYYHVKMLEKAGVVVAAEIRRRGRRDEQLWKVAAERIMLGVPGPGEGVAPGAEKAIESMMRLATRELQAAVRQRTTGDSARTTIGLRMKGRVDGETLEKINRLIARLESLIRQSAQNERGDVYSLTIAMAPTEDKSKGEES